MGQHVLPRLHVRLSPPMLEGPSKCRSYINLTTAGNFDDVSDVHVELTACDLKLKRKIKLKHKMPINLGLQWWIWTDSVTGLAESSRRYPELWGNRPFTHWFVAFYCAAVRFYCVLSVASLGLVSSGAATDGVTTIFPRKKTDDLFSHRRLQSDDLFRCPTSFVQCSI